MKKITQAEFINQTNISPELAKAVIRQIGGWKSFQQSAPDISNHGIDGGFNGFLYNKDTESFARRNRSEISAMASDQARDFGSSVTEMIQNFGCFRNGDKPTDEEIGQALYAGKPGELGILNALAWYAGEEVSRSYCDLTEQS